MTPSVSFAERRVIMMKVDVAIQSYKKPESLVYTLLSLKKYCGEHIDTIYINDDCSGEGVIEHYTEPELLSMLAPIKVKVRTNRKPSGYTHTVVTKEVLFRKNMKRQVQLLGHFFINRAKWYSTTDDIRYQWAIDRTDKEYIYLIHDDILFFDDVLGLYIEKAQGDSNLAIIGDLGGSKRCIFGPCGEKCKPQNIIDGIYPCSDYPNMGKKTIIHTLLGRYKRYCRINEWSCLLKVDACHQIAEEGVYFGNYESGGDVGTYWFERIIRRGYGFVDPLPTKEERKGYYLHWWQGHEGHDVWVDNGQGKPEYEKDMIVERIFRDFSYRYR